MVKWLQIGPEAQGQRIDNFLLKHLKGVPKSKIYNILRKGEVRVNRGRIKPSYRLCEGDQIRLPPLRQSHNNTSAKPSPQLLQLLRDAIVLEDEQILVLNKPSGVAVHKGSGIRCGIIEAMRELYPQYPFLELAHRLDRDSSGCLVFAKNPDILRKVHRALQSPDSQKRYLALLRGHWQKGDHAVTLPLRKNTLRGGERIVAVDQAGGKFAQSHFTPVTLKRRASLMQVSISTGRTHQIRVHAASLGYPVAGDQKYGDPMFNSAMHALGLQRLFLHAHSLILRLPGRELAVDAPLPDDLRCVLDNF